MDPEREKFKIQLNIKLRTSGKVLHDVAAPPEETRFAKKLVEIKGKLNEAINEPQERQIRLLTEVKAEVENVWSKIGGKFNADITNLRDAINEQLRNLNLVRSPYANGVGDEIPLNEINTNLYQIQEELGEKKENSRLVITEVVAVLLVKDGKLVNPAVVKTEWQG